MKLGVIRFPGSCDDVDALQVRVLVPEDHRLADALRGQHRVDLVARAGEADDAELQATTS